MEFPQCFPLNFILLCWNFRRNRWIDRPLFALNSTLLNLVFSRRPLLNLDFVSCKIRFELPLLCRMIFSAFSFNWASIFLSSSSNNGLHAVKVSGILCCVPGMEPWLQTHRRGQRSFSLLTVGEFGKIFSKINNYVIETIASLTIFIEIKEYFITRNIKNVSLKGHLGNHVLSCCLWWFPWICASHPKKVFVKNDHDFGEAIKTFIIY